MYNPCIPWDSTCFKDDWKTPYMRGFHNFMPKRTLSPIFHERLGALLSTAFSSPIPAGSGLLLPLCHRAHGRTSASPDALEVSTSHISFLLIQSWKKVHVAHVSVPITHTGDPTQPDPVLVAVDTWEMNEQMEALPITYLCFPNLKKIKSTFSSPHPRSIESVFTCRTM